MKPRGFLEREKRIWLLERKENKKIEKISKRFKKRY
jgi:hypothetical protein